MESIFFLLLKYEYIIFTLQNIDLNNEYGRIIFTHNGILIIRLQHQSLVPGIPPWDQFVAMAIHSIFYFDNLNYWPGLLQIMRTTNVVDLILFLLLIEHRLRQKYSKKDKYLV